MKKIFLALAAAVAAAGMMVSCGNKADAPANDGKLAVLPDSVTVCVLDNDSLLRPDMKVERVTVIDFNAPWCQPCRMLAPSFDAVAEQLRGKADFYSVNVDMNRATATAFGVQGIPHIAIVTPDGKVEGFVGLTFENIATKVSAVPDSAFENIETPEQLTAVVTPELAELVKSYEK